GEGLGRATAGTGPHHAIGRRVSFPKVFDGCYASWREVGRPWSASGGSGKTVPVDVWAFPDGLIVTIAESTLTRLLPRAWRRKRDVAAVTPETILGAHSKAVELHRDAVVSIELTRGAYRKWRRVGVDCATFEFAAIREFDLLVDRWRSAELVSLLQQIYGPRYHA